MKDMEDYRNEIIRLTGEIKDRSRLIAIFTYVKTVYIKSLEEEESGGVG
ncbi:hypothetical protein [Eisenbergiella tayi]|nr:hypothetical protein [Eisenbergiella tayi]